MGEGIVEERLCPATVNQSQHNLTSIQGQLIIRGDKTGQAQPLTTGHYTQSLSLRGHCIWSLSYGWRASAVDLKKSI